MPSFVSCMRSSYLLIVSCVCCRHTVSAVDLLFSEELGLLLEVTENSVQKVVDAYTQGGVSCKRIARCFRSTSANTV